MYNQISSNKRKTTVLVVLFTVVVLFIGWVFSQTTDIGYAGVVFAAVFSIIVSLSSYFKGDKVALLSAGAKGPITQNDNPYLYRMVENLTITAGLPMPKVYLIKDKAINAFATGRNPKHASMAVTTGAVTKLENEELEGVIAHELSHIKNYDILLMTVVIVMVGLIALLSDLFIRIRFWGGGRKRDSQGGQLQIILLIVGMVLLVLSPIIGKIIQLAISRKREFLADASGALLTRYPEGLAKALEKIATENLAMKRANNATAHLYIATPFGRGKHALAKLFATHPPVHDRISTLRKMI
ncbi:MAG: zinc metalloprotease HtpX [Parcubacteria group bacterium]|nr:zinc metalloprotease HtpX [Parcubacteria group bacterium]|tara:strand:+ start:2508 stop:3401 length:894 start_codon:yes stop_codon:yes gene_type:complete